MTSTHRKEFSLCLLVRVGAMFLTKAHDPEIGQVIDDAMRAIEKENARLKGILPKNFARPELDKRSVGRSR